MENYIIFNDWDREFSVDGTLQFICDWFNFEDAEDIDDLLDEINHGGNGSTYYIGTLFEEQTELTTAREVDIYEV